MNEAKRCNLPRHTCAGAAEILEGGRLCAWGKVTDISRRGCFIETVNPLSAGTAVQLRLTIAGTLLDIGAGVVWTTPQVGMGVYFLMVSAEEENKLLQILEEVTASSVLPAVQETELNLSDLSAVQIKREAAPDILAKIIRRINEAGVLTRQELIEMVIASR
jgi:hypothetical protein